MRDEAGLLPVALVAFAIFLMSAMDAGMKALTALVPVVQAVFVRYLVASLVLVPAFVARRERAMRPSLAANLARGVLVAATALSFFFAISRLPLALVVSVAFVAPLFIALLGRAILGEAVTGRTLVGIAGGFLGVLVILGGEIDVGAAAADLLAFAAAVGGAFGYALVAVLMRRQSAADTALSIVTYQTATAALVLAVPAAALWTPMPADALVLALAIGIAGAAGQLSMAAGLARGRAGRLALLEYTALPWAALFGFALFAEIPRIETVAGAAIIVGACLFGLRRGAPVPRGRAAGRVPIPPPATREDG